MRLRKSCRKGGLHQLIFLGILKIFNVAISWVPEISYLHFFAMPWCFSLPARAFNLCLFWWRHWKMVFVRLFHKFSSGSSSISDFSSKLTIFFDVWYIGISTQISTFLLRKHCYMKPNSLLKTCYYKKNKRSNISHMIFSFM